jgi:acyl-CoA carboxylase subunit beta
MPVLTTTIDLNSETFRANQRALEEAVAGVNEQLAVARAGGGERYVARHKERGKLLARERIELLLDRDSPFLELCALAAWGTEYTVGATSVIGIGVVEGIECLISAHDPTVRGGAMNPYSFRKGARASDIALQNRLPVVNLVESGGADLPAQAELFIPGGRAFRDITRHSAAALPTVSLVFGNSTAGGAYVPGMSDYIVMIEKRSKVFLGGPPLVKMATGEESTDEELGGASMHARVSGLADALATDEVDAIRLGRQIVSRFNWRKRGPGPSQSADEPIHDPGDLLGIASADPKVPFDPREVLARVVDGSRFDEFKPLYGSSLVTGWASIHGYPVGVLANHRGVLFSEEAHKATQFIQLANQIDVPLIFLQNTTGYMVGKDSEQGGMIKHGSKMIQAVTNATVPQLTIQCGASFGAGNYGMCGRGYAPRFLFSWPSAKTAVMGGEQAARTMQIVTEAGLARKGIAPDPAQSKAQFDKIVAMFEAQADAFYTSGLMLDDGVIDPRDTRAVLGQCLDICAEAAARQLRPMQFGVARM